MTEFRANQHVWIQLTDILRARILDGTYPADKPMPGELAISQEFGIARNTVRKALGALREEGLVYTVAQLGTFPVDHGETVD